MSRTIAELMTVLQYEMQDMNGTRFTTTQYIMAIEESVRMVKREAEQVNPEYLQYHLGEKVVSWRAAYATVKSGSVTYPAATGTAEVFAGGSTTGLLDDDKNWVTDEWVGYTLVITAGTGIAQSRTIQSNTPSVLTVTVPWTIQPDATSVYAIRPGLGIVYDSALTTPFVPESFGSPYVRIVSGTGLGQIRAIEEIGGYEIKVDTNFTTAPANNDVYEIIAITRDFSLPSDFLAVQSVQVGGEFTPQWDGGTVRPDRFKPSWSVVGSSLRVHNLTDGQIVELRYIPIETALYTTTYATSTSVPFSSDFYDQMRYFAVMKLKGWNKEDISMEASFFRPLRSNMLKRMTDHNLRGDMGVRSNYETFAG